MIDLDLDDLLHIAHRVLAEVQVRDAGLLASAAARPATTVFGADAYPTLHLRVAALAQSIARNHALADGNKRLTLVAIIAAYGLNGRRLTLTNGEAYDLVIAISTGVLSEVADLAAALDAGSTEAATPRR